MAQLARVILLLVALAVLWNLARGTFKQWLRAKFLGEDLRAVAANARRVQRGTSGVWSR